ncbi:hypothetical protein CYMTET_34625 [Cymbomonas tetramitiformis]|uniref:Uncharacterized protein n=1 Tax=Cymbomonas tetramitiformis TaxID=36881 RepID=A0AAE0FAR7_9CHLO|nr:hypothetical protein CYMTET_34625 [Cymbomonas tetramitiformis]
MTEGINAGNHSCCDCDPGQADPSSIISTEQDAAVCVLCGVVVQATVLFHPVNRHEVVSEDHRGSFRERLGCSGPVYSKDRPSKRRRINGARVSSSQDKDYRHMRDGWYKDVEQNAHRFGSRFGELFLSMLQICVVIWADSIRDDQWLRGQQLASTGMDKFWETMCYLDEKPRATSCFVSVRSSTEYNRQVTRQLDIADEDKEENGSHWTYSKYLANFFNCQDNTTQQTRFLNVIRTVMRYRTLANLAKYLGSDQVWQVPVTELIKLPSNEIEHEFLTDKVARNSVRQRVQIKLKELENDPTATLDAPQAYDKRLICVRDAWIEFIQDDSTGISSDAVEDFPKLIKLVYDDGDFNNKILLNDMLHLCKTYLVGMPHVLAKLVVLRKAVKPRKGPKKGKRTLVA